MAADTVKFSAGRVKGNPPSSSRPVETPEQRQKRKQAEKDRAQAQAYAETQSRLLKADQNQNFLKRETPFLCNVRFRCDLPEVPGDPKMMIAPIKEKELAAFSLTSLERAPVRNLCLQPDLGIPLSYLDMGVYAVPSQPQALAPEDAALVQGGTAGVTLPAHLQAAVKGGGIPGTSGKAELSWLMRTTYISNDVAERRQQGVTEKRAKAMRQAQDEAPADSREAQMDAIEASFEAAQLPPVHQTKPGMKALKVLPVLPDADRMHHSYVNMVFDNDPTAEHERLAKLSNKQRRRISEMAMMKSYALNQPDGKGGANRFVAYMVPKAPPQEEPAHPSSREDTDASIMEGEYEWVREYLYDVRQDEEKRTYILRETPTYMGYVDLNTRLMVHKRGKRMKSDSVMAQEFPRPSQITVKRLSPEGYEPPPKRQHAERQPSPAPSEQPEDLNVEAVGPAEPLDDIQPESKKEMYADLGLESSDEEQERVTPFGGADQSQWQTPVDRIAGEQDIGEQ
ncbi:hypothetical protein ABBQ32_003754 [Trebouxia sp. C0010 RCD-2024]